MNSKTPQIRFNGYSDDWEERKFFESIASTIDFRGRTPKKLGMDWSESGYLALSALNVKNGYIDPLADAHYGDENLYKKWMSGKELKKGQVLFTTEAPMGNVAQVPDNNGYILSQRTVAFETKEDMMTNDFLAVLLKSPLVFNNLSALSSGGTAKGVSQKSLKGLSITVPFDIDEQQKIGSFFKQLDDTIALHQRKLDLLKEQKKGFLQKMFPKSGAKVPELRFSGFTDDWEEHKLGDIVEKQIKGKAKFEKLIPGDVEYLDTSRLNGGQAILTNGVKDVMPDDILILWDGSKAGTIYSGFEGALGSTLKAYRTLVDSKFVYQYLKRYQESIYNNYRTPNIPHVQKDFLDVFPISFPGSLEQQKIGSFFKQLDNLITLHQRKLDLLKEQKKGFLQKMFV